IGSLLTILFGLAVVCIAPLSGAPSRPDQSAMRPIRATQATPILLTKSSNRLRNLCYGKAHRRLLRMTTPSCGRRRLSSLVESMNAVRAVATVMVGLIHLKPTNLAVAVLAICRHVDVENMPLEDTLLLWRKGSLAPV